MIGAVLIIFTDAPLWTVNLAGLVTFGLLLPFMVVTLTLMYLDPRSESVPEPGSWRQRLSGGVERRAGQTGGGGRLMIARSSGDARGAGPEGTV